MAIFQGEPGLASFIGAKDDESGGAVSRAKLQSNYHHQQTNTYCFTGRMPFLSPKQQCQSTERKANIWFLTAAEWTKFIFSTQLMRSASRVLSCLSHCQKVNLGLILCPPPPYQSLGWINAYIYYPCHTWSSEPWRRLWHMLADAAAAAATDDDDDDDDDERCSRWISWVRTESTLSAESRGRRARAAICRVLQTALPAQLHAIASTSILPIRLYYLYSYLPPTALVDYTLQSRFRFAWSSGLVKT